MAPDLSAKRLHILHTLNARLSRFAILWDSSNPGMVERVRETKTAAERRASCCIQSVRVISRS
jgi:hypothetical protein